MSETLNETQNIAEFGDKADQLASLSAVVSDFVEDGNLDTTKFDPHFILYDGNHNSDIMVLQMKPNMVENFWAKKKNVHNWPVLLNSNAQRLRGSIIKAGYNPDDFFYTNVIPFRSVADRALEQQEINHLIWIFDSILDIIKPKIVITLGYDALNALTDGTIDKVDYLAIVKRHKDPAINSQFQDSTGILQFENMFVVPFEHPDLYTSFQHGMLVSYETRLALLKTYISTIARNK